MEGSWPKNASREDLRQFWLRTLWAIRAIRIWEEDLTQRRLEAVHNTGCEIWIMAGLRSQGEIAGTIDQHRLFWLNNLGIDAVLLNDPSLLVNTRQNWKLQ